MAHTQRHGLGVDVDELRDFVHHDGRSYRRPKERDLARWMADGVGRAVDGCKVAADLAECEHGAPAWLSSLGLL
jgi:hypothetical protein